MHSGVGPRSSFTNLGPDMRRERVTTAASDFPGTFLCSTLAPPSHPLAFSSQKGILQKDCTWSSLVYKPVVT